MQQRTRAAQVPRPGAIMRKDTASRRAEARIQHCCCLGLESGLVIPDLLRDLHQVIPSYSNTFYWVDADGDLVNAFDEQPDATCILPEYIGRFYNAAETAVHPGFTRVAREAHGVLDNASFFTVSDAHLRQSAFYARIMRPQRYHYVLQLYVRLAGRTRGILQLQRGADERDFSPSEHRTLGRLQGFLATLLMAPREHAPGGTWVDDGNAGLLLADTHGDIVSASPRGHQLLFLAMHPAMPAHAVERTKLPPELSVLCRRLRAIRRGQAQHRPPLHVSANTWGRFIFSAYPLDPACRDDRLTGIHVRREVPLLLRLLSATDAFDLSRRQAQIAVLLAGGLSHRDIAERLGLRRNTVISHSRWIYSKLAVHDSRSLREVLLAARTHTLSSTPDDTLVH